MISAAELTSMQAVQALTMTQVATILRVAEVSDGAGGYALVWTSTGTCACRVAPLSAQGMIQFAARLGENVGWRVTLAALTDVTAKDVLKVDSGATARYFEVLGVLAAWTYETARQCVCIEREAVAVSVPSTVTYLLDFSDAVMSMYLGAI